MADGKTVQEAAALVGLNLDYARRVVRRYNRDGPAGVRDRRRASTPPVRPPLRTAEQQELAAAVQGPAPAGGLWTGARRPTARPRLPPPPVADIR